LAWGLATLAACFLVGFLLGRWQAQKESAAYALLQNQKVISEMLSLFPNQVRAIVQDERGINLVLSDQADVPLSAPLWVKVRDGKRWAAAITFSGQDIQLAGRQFTVLSDGRGGILLMGNDFVWSSEQPAEARSRLKFEARNLGPLTM
jgi:hypothetical protein